jgi:hypothetical protein
MSKDELVHVLTKKFNVIAQVHSRSPYRIEVDVSKALSREEWLPLLDDLNLTDNSSHIPDSYKHNDITVMFFNGNITSFKGKGYFG